MKARIPYNQQELAGFCRKWSITEFAVFGSVLRSDFRANSDVDVLVRFAPGARRSLFDLDLMEDALQILFDHRVDLLTWPGVEQSRNVVRRESILSTAKVLYRAA